MDGLHVSVLIIIITAIGGELALGLGEQKIFNLGDRSKVVIVIVISGFLKRYSKAKRNRASAYSRALRRIKGGLPKGVKRSPGPIFRVPGAKKCAVKPLCCRLVQFEFSQC